MEGVPVVVGETLGWKAIPPLAELRERLDQLQADHRQEDLALGQRKPLGGVSLSHRRHDHVLAVHQRAVAVKNH